VSVSKRSTFFGKPNLPSVETTSNLDIATSEIENNADKEEEEEEEEEEEAAQIARWEIKSPSNPLCSTHACHEAEDVNSAPRSPHRTGYLFRHPRQGQRLLMSMYRLFSN
jgi:hypothetical protein